MSAIATHGLTANGRVKRTEGVVKIADLGIDMRYQRELKQSLVDRILADYDIVAADLITVSRRADGTLWIVNGQHRTAAAKLAGETEMLALIYDGLTLEEEADLRLKSNNRRADTPQERFYGQLTKGDEESLAIQQLLAAVGSRVNRSPNQSSGVNCVSTLEYIYRKDAGLTLRSTLRLLFDAFGPIQGEIAQESVIHGTAWFIKQHGAEVSRADVVKRMRHEGVQRLLTQARTHQQVARGALWLNFYRALVEMWNYKRGEKNRIEPRTTRWGDDDVHGFRTLKARHA